MEWLSCDSLDPAMLKLKGVYLVFDNIFKFFRKEEKSKDLAKERLKLVLIHDKANVSPQFLEMVKGELIKVIKKYMEIDEEALDIQLTKVKSDEGDRIVPQLVANIPIINVKSTDVEKIKVNTEEEKKEEKVEVSSEKDEKAEKPKIAIPKKPVKK